MDHPNIMKTDDIIIYSRSSGAWLQTTDSSGQVRLAHMGKVPLTALELWAKERGIPFRIVGSVVPIVRKNVNLPSPRAAVHSR